MFSLVFFSVDIFIALNTVRIHVQTCTCDTHDTRDTRDTHVTHMWRERAASAKHSKHVSLACSLLFYLT